MKLADLNPRWLERDGTRLGLILQCPHCVAAGLTRPALGEAWHHKQHVSLLTCFFQPTPKKEQFKLLWAAGEELDEDGYPSVHIIPCNPSAQWKVVGGSDFADLSLAPSLDASAAGHWHGHLTDGEIK